MEYANTSSLDAARNFIQQGSHQQAWYILDQMLKYNPPEAEAYFLLSLISDDPDECVHLLNNALSIDPRHVAARRRLNDLRPQAAPQWKASSPKTPTPSTPMPPVPPLVTANPVIKNVSVAESPVLASLPEGIKLTAKGISYQFSGSRLVPFM